MNIDVRPLEIFCGTGGVGKTTVSASRAAYLALNGYKVLLITIDPAQRLKDVLEIANDNNRIHSVGVSKFIKRKAAEKKSFDVELFTPEVTLKRYLGKKDSQSIKTNPIIKALIRPGGGMNEITATIEVDFHIESNKYDTIILDTPPGKHFIDFLNSSKKINNFFNKNFKQIYDNLVTPNSRRGFLSIIISKGTEQIFKYLEELTGDKFISNLRDVAKVLYLHKDRITQSSQLQKYIKDQSLSNWFLVNTPEHQKYNEALELQNEAKSLVHDKNILIINRSNKKNLLNWNIETDTDKELSMLKSSMIKRENNLLKLSKKHFSKTIVFSDVLDESPKKHISELIKCWSQEKQI